MKSRALLSGGIAGLAKKIALVKRRNALKEGRKPQSYPRGTENGSAKLTEADVRAIREEFASGGIQKKQLAERYRVGQSTIGEIIRYKTWRHV